MVFLKHKPDSPFRGNAMKRICLFLAFLVFLPTLAAFPQSLKEMYDLSGPASGYDKYITLDTGKVYTGGLYIGLTFNRITALFEGDQDLDVRIKGNGAILDLQGEEICISYCYNKLDIDDCIIINGNIRFRGVNDSAHSGIPTGSVKHVTFYKPHDYAIRFHGSGAGITVERNIVADAVNTGPDFHYIHGFQLNWLPTGTSFAPSAFVGLYGFPVLKDNWSFHSNPGANNDPLRHFSLLCEYG